MTPRAIVSGALAAAVIVIGYLILSSGPSPYVLKLSLADANGLRQGSPVAIAGQDVGTIGLAVRHDRVIVTLDIDRSHAPLGRDATASIAAVNLLGQKRIQLTRGAANEPAPSGYMLPAAQVSVSTDIDQVLDVLTPDVRARLAILINEAGQAFTGRQADFSQVLLQLPPDLVAGQQLLHAVAADNHTLGNLVQTSDGFVTELAQQHTALLHALDVVGQTAQTLATRRAQLSQTLADAPQTLTTLNTFLAKLQATTVPLGPAARDITATAPELSDALAQVNPFRVAADPTLDEATQVAPELTHLATGATPVLTRATPVVGQLATASRDLQPISDILDKSVDNILATVQNWSRAIQFRDGLSHVFRGEATFSPETLVNLIQELQANPVGGSSLAKELAELARPARTHASAARHPAAPHTTSAHSNGTGLGAGASKPSSPASSPAPASTSSTGSASSGSPSGGGRPLQSLLSYLLKP